MVAIDTKIENLTDRDFMALSKDRHNYHPDEKYVLVYHSTEPDGFLRPQDKLE